MFQLELVEMCHSVRILSFQHSVKQITIFSGIVLSMVDRRLIPIVSFVLV